MKKFLEQPSDVRDAYVEYVDEKNRLEEKPLSFNEWATLEREIDSPIGAIIE